MHRLALAAVLGGALLGLADGGAWAGEAGYPTQPALHGDHLVFASEGDLWSVRVPPPASDGPLTAARLTSAAGEESRPRFSPDGRVLAFTGQYDGNPDVFVMPAAGGAPRRLTSHPEVEVALGFTPDGAEVLFRSAAAHPHGRPELWRVPAQGGSPVRYGFGECSLASIHPDGRRIAFTRWSNETWSWKRYRGGTAPDVWLGDLATGEFRRLTATDANDLFPMWVGDRVAFLSDRTGTANLWVDTPGKDAPEPLTAFASVPGDPTALAGYDARWPSVDAAPGGTRIAFVQAGDLVLLDPADRAIRRLDVRLASDRPATRERFEPATRTTTGYSVSGDGKEVWLESRGELLAIPVRPGLPVRHLTKDPVSRESGATPLGRDAFAFVTDSAGEPRVAVAPLDGSKAPEIVSEAGEGWIFAPAASPDGRWVAFGDKALGLHLVEVATRTHRVVDRSEAWEIRDYRFSPDSRWLAYVKPMPNQTGHVWLHEIETGASWPVSGALDDDREPRFDPAGKYLYLLSRRHLDPVLSDLDFEHAYLATTMVLAVPLANTTPPPLPAVARAAGFDLRAWAKGPRGGPDDDDEEGGDGDDERRHAGLDLRAREQEAGATVAVEPAGLPDRRVELPLAGGEYAGLEAVSGGVLYLRSRRDGLLGGNRRGGSPFEDGDAVLLRYDLAKEEDPEATLAEKVTGYALSANARWIAIPGKQGFTVLRAGAKSAKDGRTVAVDGVRIRVDPREEWRHILGEAWRLQRDFYWAPTYRGTDWPAMRTKYEALLPRVGTRAELNDLIGQMIGELATSHTYVYGGEAFAPPRSVRTGLLGADLVTEGDRVVIRRKILAPAWAEGLASPLAAPHLAVDDGSILLAVDGVPVASYPEVAQALEDRAGVPVRLAVADDPSGSGRREITVTPLASERDLRYAAWVEGNRRYVEERSKGVLGYLHVPDMGGNGLVAFGRLFYPQITKKGLVVDIRDNGGGFVSQLIIRRLDRKPWAFMQPRHGTASRYPDKSLHGHMAVLIDQHAGSDGDIFPASFRILGLGPLIGTRTWGGVVGIRSDKPFVDLGMSTQPEFAWWSPKDGWSVENRGVSPDVEVEVTPGDHLANRDPQLDRAIDWLLEQIRQDPKDLPEMPPYPTK